MTGTVLAWGKGFAVALCLAGASLLPATLLAGSADAGAAVRTPNVPQGVTATASAHQVAISWLVLSDDGWGGPVDNYLATIIGPDGRASTVFATAPPIIFTGLRHGVYAYYVAAHNADGWGHTTTSATVAVPSEPDRMAVPHASSVKSDTLTVTWNAPGSDGGSQITGYQVLFDGEVHDAPATAREAIFTALGGTTHTVRVRARNMWGFGEYSGTHYAHARGEPGPVLAVSATVHGTTVSVTWTPPENDGGRSITTYKVRVFNGAYEQRVGAQDLAEFAGLRPDTDYRVGVAAVSTDPSDGLGVLTGPEYKVMIHTGGGASNPTVTVTATAESSSPAPATTATTATSRTSTAATTTLLPATTATTTNRTSGAEAGQQSSGPPSTTIDPLPLIAPSDGTDIADGATHLRTSASAAPPGVRPTAASPAWIWWTAGAAVAVSTVLMAGVIARRRSRR